MSSIFLIIYFLAMLTSGYVVVSFAFKGKAHSFIETVSLSMLLGAGTVSVIFFWLTLIGLKPARSIILIIFCIASLFLTFLHHKKKTAPLIFPGKLIKNEWFYFVIVGIVLIFMFGIVTAHSLCMPLYDIDAYSLWGLKAKALYYEGFSDGGHFYQLPLSFSHLNYPLLVPFLISGVYAAIGQVHDLIGKIIFPFFFIGIAGFMFTSLRWKLERIPSLLLTVLLLSTPVMIRWAGAGKADFVLAVFHAVSVFYLVKFIKEENRSDLIIALLGTFFCAFVKNEGIALMALNIAVLVGFYGLFPISLKKLKVSAIFIFIISLLMLPWFFWASDIPQTHENYNKRVFDILHNENLHRMKDILGYFSGLLRTKENFSGGFFNISRWGMLWIILPIAGLLRLSAWKERYILAMWSLLILQIALYFYVFMISPWDPATLAEMALERIFLHASPLALYLIAFHIGYIKTENVAKD